MPVLHNPSLQHFTGTKKGNVHISVAEIPTHRCLVNMSKVGQSHDSETKEEEDSPITPIYNQFLDKASDEEARSDTESVTSNASDDSVIEPFDVYKEKIRALCVSLSLVDYEIEAIQHSYQFQNCVYALSSHSQKYVLRVPQCPQLRESDGLCEEMMHEIAILELLQYKLPVSRVKAYDLSENNVLEKPFMIQTRIEGVPLCEVYQTMHCRDKWAIINQFVDLMARTEGVCFPRAGNLKSKGDLPLPKSSDYISNITTDIELFDSRTPSQEPESDVTRLVDRQGSKVQSLMRSLLEGWIERDRAAIIARLERQGIPIEEAEEMSLLIPRFQSLLTILQEMEAEKIFKDEPYPIVLHHWDLEPRNIMVENSTGEWKISGIIDWDGAEAVPLPLARKPPTWMWDWSDEPSNGFLDYDQYQVRELDDRAIVLRNHFIKTVKPVLQGYEEDAFGPGRWLRRMFVFAKSGLNQSHMVNYLDELIEQWEARPKPVASLSKRLYRRALDGLNSLFGGFKL